MKTLSQWSPPALGTSRHPYKILTVNLMTEVSTKGLVGEANTAWIPHFPANTVPEKCHRTAQNGVQMTPYDSLISGIFHVIRLDYGGPWIHSKNHGK